MEPGDCVVCGQNVHDDRDVFERYTLVHDYALKKGGQLGPVASGTGQERTFCSAKCLTKYVNEKIAPDAAGE
jgi:hypothetical protein